MIDSIKIGFAEHTMAILVMLLIAFLLGLLLGYILWYTYKKQVAGITLDRDQWHNKYTDLEKSYASLKYQHDELEKDNKAMRRALNNCEADKVILENKLQKAGDTSAMGAGMETAAAAVTARTAERPSGYGAMFKEDNLQIIEGIGPKIEKVLHGAGIQSWSALSKQSLESLREKLDAAGPNFRINDPSSWPRQAELAAAGNWEELIQYQKFLDTGRENTGDFENDSKLEKLALKMMGIKSDPNDLKIIEGIGPKIEQLLKDAGINTWQHLAGASVEKIQEVLDNAGSRYKLANPSTWPKQAELAAGGKWDELKEYQDYLQGGKEV
jgi:predicted flap endonuclease-1-like 5' DNA nuclease